MATAKLNSEAKENTITFGVLISMVVQRAVAVCEGDLECMSRKE